MFLKTSPCLLEMHNGILWIKSYYILDFLQNYIGGGVGGSKAKTRFAIAQ